MTVAENIDKNTSLTSFEKNIAVLNFEANKEVSKLELNPKVFDAELRMDLLHRVVEWQRAGKRLGTHKTKQIGDISGTTKKPWKQKGTGRARQGSLRSPQFRGGAVIFGPVVRSHAYDLPKAVRRKALTIALSLKLASGKLKIVENLAISSHKTKNLVQKTQALGISSGLFVGVDKEKEINFYKACANVHKLDVLPTLGLNVYDILNHEYLVMTAEAVEMITQRLA